MKYLSRNLKISADGSIGSSGYKTQAIIGITFRGKTYIKPTADGTVKVESRLLGDKHILTDGEHIEVSGSSYMFKDKAA